jgi:hypothetical protein
MARRNREQNIAMAGGQLAVLAVLIAMVSPQVRDGIEPFGRIAVLLLSIVAAGLACGLVVFVTRSRTRHHHHLSAPELSLHLSVSPALNSDPSNLRARLRRLDWFQFEKLVALVYQKQPFIDEQGNHVL